MSGLYTYKSRAFKRQKPSRIKENKQIEDDDDDGETSDLDDYLTKYAADENENEHGTKKKKKTSKKRKKHTVIAIDISDEEAEEEVEPLAPAVVVDLSGDDDEDENDEALEEEEVDEATKRRRKLLVEAREAREALMRTEREGEAAAAAVEIFDDDEEIEDTKNEDRHEEEEEEAPPRAQDFGPKIKVRLRCGNESDIHILGAKERFDRIFKAFAEERGVDLKQCKFSFDGQKLAANQTPTTLDLEEEDLIDVTAPPRTKAKSNRIEESLFEDEEVPHQAKQDEVIRPVIRPRESNQEPIMKKKKKKHDKVLLVVKASSDRKPQKFKIHDDDAFEKALAHYAKKRSLILSACSFQTIDSVSIDVKKAPADYDLSGEIQLVASLPQLA